MKLFDGRSAAEEYMSTHTLTFSTPEMTLNLFSGYRKLLNIMARKYQE